MQTQEEESIFSRDIVHSDQGQQQAEWLLYRYGCIILSEGDGERQGEREREIMCVNKYIYIYILQTHLYLSLYI